MKYGRELRRYYQEHWEADTAKQIEDVREEMQRLVDEERAKRKEQKAVYEAEPRDAGRDRVQPVIIGQNVYVMMPMDMDAGGFRKMLENSPAARDAMDAPIEIEAEAVEVK